MDMAGSIICGVDGSESAKGAARVARRLSAELGRRLVFVRVIDVGSSEVEISAVAERLRKLTESATEVDCGADWVVEAGRPVDRLVALAADEEASLIIVGSTGPRSSLLGSISAEISRRAPCPVVVVAPGADSFLAKGHSRAGARGGLPGPLGEGYPDSDWSLSAANRDRAAHDPAERDFAGGIARLGLGGKE
jgi:nucleotide-binding universal stress UspA family protein